MIPTPVAFVEASTPMDGLRSHKKLKTRLAIQRAALELFAEKGFDETGVDEIALRAEVSTTTFFTYFRSKADVIAGDHVQRLAALRQAISQRPASETDLEAVRRGVEAQWADAVDLDRTVLQARAIKISPVLRGLSVDVGNDWLAATAEALAQRRGLDAPDQSCTMSAKAALIVIGHALNAWMGGGCRGELAAALDESCALMMDVCEKWRA
jgi:AcrR family transcriptional regulator